MRQELIRTVLFTVLAACLALLAALAVSATAGWIVFCLGLGAQMAAHFRNFALLDRWSRAPDVDANLEGRGAWDGIFGRLYRHEKDLRAQIERRSHRIDMLLAAIQALNDGVVLLNDRMHIVFCNATAEALLGLQARTDIGQSVANLVRQPEFVAFLLAGDFARPLTIRSERNPGCVLSIHLIPYAENRTLMQIKDVTQTERLDRMRRDFVANVSHELRTPLTVVHGYLDMMEPEDFPDTGPMLMEMRKQSQRMAQLVEDLLTLSRLESQQHTELETVAMASMLASLRREAQAHSQGRHEIRIEDNAGVDLAGSNKELHSAFSNLVTNAVRYTPAGGRITLTFAREDEGAVLAVSDTGYGIPANHLPRLTERFYRVSSSRSRESGGTGLGLSIVKHILGLHQARLEIRSEVGQGSTFACHFDAEHVRPRNAPSLPPSTEDFPA